MAFKVEPLPRIRVQLSHPKTPVNKSPESREALEIGLALSNRCPFVPGYLVTDSSGSRIEVSATAIALTMDSLTLETTPSAMDLASGA